MKINNLKANLSNNTLIVALPSGELLFSSNGSKELFYQVMECETIEEVKQLLAPELSKEESIIKEQIKVEEQFKDNLNVLSSNPIFEYKDNLLYLKGINVSIPKILAQQFVQASLEGNSKQFNALLNFWYLACLNPNNIAREGLFEFLQRSNFKIMENGMVLAYRSVVSVGNKNKELVEFISNNYIKIKTKWKKNASDYDIFYANKKYILSKNTPTDDGLVYEHIGNLKDLYLELPNMQENTYTDQHTKTMQISIGREVSMDRKLCDESKDKNCSRGLHLCTDIRDYASFGDTKLLCAFSPRNVVSVPENHTTKMRVCAYMPLAVLQDGEEDFLLEADTLELIDEYSIEEIDNIQKLAEESDAQELKKHYLLSSISQKEFNNILDKLDEIKYEISSRINEIS